MEGSDRGPLVRCTAGLTLDRSSDKSRQFDAASVLVCNIWGGQIEISVNSDCRFAWLSSECSGETLNIVFKYVTMTFLYTLTRF